ATACFAAVSICYALGLVLVLGLDDIADTPATASRSIAASIGTAARTVWRDPSVRAVLLITIVMNVLHFPYQQMLPVVARQVLGSGPKGLGVMVAANGLGALLGAVAIASRGGFVPHRRLFATAVLLGPLLLIVLAASQARW